MYRKILAPLDGSYFSELALPRALGLAQRWDAEVELVTVANPGGVRRLPEPTELIGDESRDRAKGEARDYLSSVESRVREAGFEGELGRSVIPSGNVSSSLVRHLRDVGADFAVMTTHGRGPLERGWLGSSADGFIRRSPVPVLLVRPREEDGEEIPESGTAPIEVQRTGFRKVLFPLDGSPAGERMLELASPLLDEESRALLLRVIPPPVPGTSPYLPHLVQEARDQEGQKQVGREYLEGLVHRTPAADVDVRVVSAAQPAVAILRAVDEQDVDLVAMSTAGRGGVARLLLGSVADKVIRGVPVPVLVFREPEEKR